MKKRGCCNLFRQKPSKKAIVAMRNLYSGLSRTQITGIIAGFFLLIFCSLLVFSIWQGSLQHEWILPQSQSAAESTEIASKIAILDGLYSTNPNTLFTDNLTKCFAEAGFQVDLFRGENVTIDLLRNVEDYKILVLRIHSAIHTDGFLYLFSGEPYTESKYMSEQLSGGVRAAHPFNEEETYFAIKAMFLGESKPQGLKNTVVLLMGCNGTEDAYSINRLLGGGLEAFIGWNGYVSLAHSDASTSKLMEAFCMEGLSWKEAVDKVMREVGPDTFGSTFEYYGTP